ncbi:hypothetical protein VZQ01_06740 [Myxococcus faecalis]|uniref:hypothetical protein n=1 Tax=Myxococcus faecalis TaxID=3115646 RepID=UPI003CF21251
MQPIVDALIKSCRLTEALASKTTTYAAPPLQLRDKAREKASKTVAATLQAYIEGTASQPETPLAEEYLKAHELLHELREAIVGTVASHSGELHEKALRKAREDVVAKMLAYAEAQEV